MRFFLLIAVVAISVLAVGCSHPPIKKGCKEIGKTSDGVGIFDSCEDI